MGYKHCKNAKMANAFMKGLRAKATSYKNTNIKKHKNKDGSYLVSWVVEFK